MTLRPTRSPHPMAIQVSTPLPPATYSLTPHARWQMGATSPPSLSPSMTMRMPVASANDDEREDTKAHKMVLNARKPRTVDEGAPGEYHPDACQLTLLNQNSAAANPHERTRRHYEIKDDGAVPAVASHHKGQWSCGSKKTTNTSRKRQRHLPIMREREVQVSNPTIF